MRQPHGCCAQICTAGAGAVMWCCSHGSTSAGNGAVTRRARMRTAKVCLPNRVFFEQRRTCRISDISHVLAGKQIVICSVLMRGECKSRTRNGTRHVAHPLLTWNAAFFGPDADLPMPLVRLQVTTCWLCSGGGYIRRYCAPRF